MVWGPPLLFHRVVRSLVFGLQGGVDDRKCFLNNLPYVHRMDMSRSPQMDEALFQQLLQEMAAKGFNTEKMIRTSQPITESGNGKAPVTLVGPRLN